MKHGQGDLARSLCPMMGGQRHGTVRFAGLSNSLRSHGTAVGVAGFSGVSPRPQAILCKRSATKSTRIPGAKPGRLYSRKFRSEIESSFFGRPTLRSRSDSYQSREALLKKKQKTMSPTASAVSYGACTLYSPRVIHKASDCF